MRDREHTREHTKSRVRVPDVFPRDRVFAELRITGLANQHSEAPEAWVIVNMHVHGRLDLGLERAMFRGQTDDGLYVDATWPEDIDFLI